MTADELYSSQYLNLDLDGVEDVSWLANMQDLFLLSLDGGDIDDLSVLAELPELKYVFLTKVPITDIDFAKKIDLDILALREMEQITTEQRLEVVRYGDIKLKKGFSASVGVLPLDIFEPEEGKVYIGDKNIVSYNDDTLESDELGSYRFGGCAAVYGNECGETDYMVYFNEDLKFEGKIIVEEADHADIPDVSPAENALQVFYSEYYGDEKAILNNGTVYGLQGDKLIICEKNVKKFSRMYYYSETSNYYSGCDGVLLENGTVKVNGKIVDVPESSKNIKFRDINGSYLIDENNKLYYLKLDEDEYTAVYFGDDCAAFLEDGSGYVMSTSGKVCKIDRVNKNGVRSYVLYPTEIEEPISWYFDYFVDKNNILWKINSRSNTAPTITQIDKDVAEVGFMLYSNGNIGSSCYVKNDGSAYTADRKTAVEIYERPAQPFVSSGRFRVNRGELMSSQLTPEDYFMGSDNVLTMSIFGEEAAVKGVSEYLFDTYENGVLTAYFTRIDNTVWSYTFGEGKYTQLMPEEGDITVKGDANGDGMLTIADAVLMQKYLTGQSISWISDSCDLDGDGKITVYDFIIMRKLIIGKREY